MDADINVAKNHEIDLPAIPHSKEFSILAKSEGFYWLPNGLFRMDGSELRVPNTPKANDIFVYVLTNSHWARRRH